MNEIRENIIKKIENELKPSFIEVIDESHLSSEWQMKAIQQFCKSKKERFEKLKNMLPSFDEESAEV